MTEPLKVQRAPFRLVKGQAKSGRSLRILLVEDHADSAEAIITILDRMNHRVQWVSTGAAALAVLDRASRPGQGGLPDEIILDLMLPDMSGLEMIQELRAAGTQLPPVIVLSAKPLATIRADAQAMGAAVFLRKPFSTDDLMQAVESASPAPSVL
jgi:two-component system, OmpR family, response regulator TctD